MFYSEIEILEVLTRRLPLDDVQLIMEELKELASKRPSEKITTEEDELVRRYGERVESITRQASERQYQRDQASKS
jgi:hypothetical protein